MIRLRILKAMLVVVSKLQYAASRRGNDPFEDTERYLSQNAPTIPMEGRRGNDPFEDTESKENGKLNISFALVAEAMIRLRILKVSQALRRRLSTSCRRGNDPFED